MIYQASVTGRCSKAYMDVFMHPYKLTTYTLIPKHAEQLQNVFEPFWQHTQQVKEG